MYHTSISGRRHASPSYNPPSSLFTYSGRSLVRRYLYNENNTVVLPPERTDKGCARNKTIVTVVVANLRRILGAR